MVMTTASCEASTLAASRIPIRRSTSTLSGSSAASLRRAMNRNTGDALGSGGGGGFTYLFGMATSLEGDHFEPRDVEPAERGPIVAHAHQHTGTIAHRVEKAG